MTFRAVATAAISAALAGTTLAVVSPATAAPSDQLGCQYPANFVTITVLDLSRSTVQYGARVTVRVNVNAVGTNRDPDGSVVVRVAGDSGSDQLNNSGIAHVKLPRLETGNYTVSARYNPEKCSRFQVSSDTRSLRVVKAGSKTKVNVGNVERGDHPKARVEVETSTGVTARGDVRVHISSGPLGPVMTIARRRPFRPVAGAYTTSCRWRVGRLSACGTYTYGCEAYGQAKLAC